MAPFLSSILPDQTGGAENSPVPELAGSPDRAAAATLILISDPVGRGADLSPDQPARPLPDDPGPDDPGLDAPGLDDPGLDHTVADHPGAEDPDPVGAGADHGRRRELADWTRTRLREGHERGGDALKQAQAAVITEHLWLARAVAHRYHFRGEDDDDLMQVASIGLVEAVNRFDPERGDFLAFAAPTISGVVKRHFRDHGWLVRPPRRTQELAGNIRRKWADLTQELGAEPTDRQLGEHLGETVTDVVEARCASHGYRAVSMNKLSDDPRLKVIGDRDLEEVEARVIVERVINRLDDTDQRLLRMRFYEGRSQSDIAAEIGTNQMQVSRKLARLLTRMRSMLGTEDARLLAS